MVYLCLCTVVPKLFLYQVAKMFISAMKHFQTEVHWEFKWKAKSTSTFFATSALVLFLAFMYSYYRQNILRCLDLRYRLFSVKTHLTSVSLFFDSVKFNKLTDVGAQSLGASLRNCTKVKTLRWGALSCYFITHLYFFQFFMGFFFLPCFISFHHPRMWNQCIPFGVLERLIQQDSRILLH